MLFNIGKFRGRLCHKNKGGTSLNEVKGVVAAANVEPDKRAETALQRTNGRSRKQRHALHFVQGLWPPATTANRLPLLSVENSHAPSF
jgi:hypothetical protein